MRGWRDRILGAGMMLVAVGVMVFALNRPLQPGEFTVRDQGWLHENFPSGHYYPDRDHAIYYQVCLEQSWHRFWANGTRLDTRIWCWK